MSDCGKFLSRIPVLLSAILIASNAQLPARADGAKSFVAHIPQRIAAFTVGTLAGTIPLPWFAARGGNWSNKQRRPYELRRGTKPIGYLTAGVFGIPQGIPTEFGTGREMAWLIAGSTPKTRRLARAVSVWIN